MLDELAGDFPGLGTALDGLRQRRRSGGLTPPAVPARRGAAPDKVQQALLRRLRDAVLADVPAYTASGNPEVLPELEGHALEHLVELQRLLGGGAIGDFGFVRAYARRTATQRFPLEASLRAHRCMQPLWLHSCLALAPAAASAPAGAAQRATALAHFCAEYTNAIAIVAAAEYVAQTRLLAEAEGERRNELLGILVSGCDESDARVARLLKRAGYLEQRLSFCVALAQSTDPLEMENAARAQRIADALAAAVAPLSVRTLVGLRSNLVVAVFSDLRRVSGWTAPQAGLADRLRPCLQSLGPVVLIGLSSDQPSTAYIPQALHEATVALDFASVAERVVPFSELPIRRLLIHRGADYVQSALPVWFTRLRQGDAKTQGALVKTLRAMADANINVQAAARQLGLHPNTVYGRLQRIADLTGLDGQRYHDLTHLLLAVDCGRL